MPPKNRKPSLSQLQPRVTKKVHQSPLSYYKQFITDKLAPKGADAQIKSDIKNWSDVNLNTEEGKIQNEIAKKFIANKLNIDKLSYINKPPNEYGTDDDKPFIKLMKPPKYDNFGKSIKSEIDPTILSHELIHANDHQLDNLNLKTWDYLEKLYNNPSITDLSTSVRKIQNKIDPSTIFSTSYPLDRDEAIKHINLWKRTQTPPQADFVTDLQKSDWSTTFPEMIPVLTDRTPLPAFNKKPFLLNYASEFPAFVSERLTRNWDTSSGGTADRLNTPEARFMRNVLNDMSTAYPTGEYPTMNRHIQDRAKSIESARIYSQPLAHGGRITSHKQSPSNTIDADIMDFIEANKRRRSHPQMPNLHHDAIKRGFTIASSDPKEINRLLELTENGTSKEFNDYLLSIGMNQVSRKKPKNILDKFLEQLEPPKYPKPRNKLEKIADDLGEAMNFGN